MSAMRSKVIALLTDFGTRDSFVAQMKGTILARCDAEVVDLSHEIEPFDIFEAAMFLRSTVDAFAPDTIFVAVVDPGVGTGRRILAVADRKHVFLAPDNGLLSPVLSNSARIHSVENPKFFLPDGSTTFHGRDRFAPVAAAIAGGTKLEALGPRMSDIVHLAYEEPVRAGNRIRGSVIAIDRFGNAITDIDRALMGDSSLADLEVRGHHIHDVATSYEEGGLLGQPFAIWGSRGTLEISLARANAAEVLQIVRLDTVEVALATH